MMRRRSKALGLGEKSGEEWKKVASTSRRHDVYVRPTEASSEYEMTTRLAPNHPLYKSETDDQPSGPVLRITL